MGRPHTQLRSTPRATVRLCTSPPHELLWLDIVFAAIRPRPAHEIEALCLKRDFSLYWPWEDGDKFFLKLLFFEIIVLHTLNILCVLNPGPRGKRRWEAKAWCPFEKQPVTLVQG